MNVSLCPHVLKLHIRSTLQLAEWWSPAAEELLIGTAAQESHLGYWRKQLDNGPGRGLYSIETAVNGNKHCDENDIWDNFLAFKSKFREIVKTISGVVGPNPVAMENNLAYQHLMCRLHYMRIDDLLPEATDVMGMAKYWKDHFNTHLGEGTVGQFITNYQRYVLRLSVPGS